MAEGYPDYTLQIDGVVQLNNGGTGVTSLPAGSIPIGNGNQPLLNVPAGSDGNILVWNAGLGLPNWTLDLGNIAFFGDNSGTATIVVVGNSTTPTNAFIEWQDHGSGLKADVALATQAGTGVANSAQDDFVIVGPTAKRIILAEGVSGPQIILDAGGVQLPAVESVAGIATTGPGVAGIVASSNQPNKNGALTLANLFTPAAAGLFRISLWFEITTGGGAGNYQMNTTFTSLIGADVHPNGSPIASANPARGSDTFCFYSGAGDAIGVTVVPAGGVVGSVYSLFVRLESLG